MDFQEGMKFMIHRPLHKKWASEKVDETEVCGQPATPRRRWKIFYRSSPLVPSKPYNTEPPREFLCPISGSLMADPVIVSSGHTFERASVLACKNLNFNPILADGSKPDFSTVIPNLALKSAVTNWSKTSSRDPPKPPDLNSIEKTVRSLMATHKPKPNTQEQEKVILTEEDLIQGIKEKPNVNFNHAATEVARRQNYFYSSSEESVATTGSSPPLQLSTRPSCYSSSSSTEIETLNPNSPEKEDIVKKLRSAQVFEVEEAVISLRKITRTRDDARVHLCTPRLLSILRSLVISKYTTIQVNTVAAVVNLSLEKANKVKIVRSGIVPPLIDVLKGGFSEAQGHACGAIFSLALDDDNKTAIGVLGALPPLLHLLRSENEGTRHDSALTLYHLSLVQSNRTKLVKMGSVPVLLGLVKAGHLTGRILLILCNLGSCADGRAAMLDAGAVECLVELLNGNELSSGSTRESCVAAMFALSHGGLRFKAVAKEAGVVEALRKVEKIGSERAQEKVKRMLEMMRGREEEEEDVDWEELLESGLGTRTQGRHCGGSGGYGVNSSEF